MRCLLTIGIFFFLLANSNSQTYVPMPMQNCTWQMQYSATCALSPSGTSAKNYTIYPQGDTLILSKTYRKLYAVIQTTNTGSGCTPYWPPIGQGYYGGLRQDTLNQKIYFLQAGSNQENLLYNFNVNKGDTVNTWMEIYKPADKRTVDSAFYQLFSDGNCRRVYLLKPQSATLSASPYNMNYDFYTKIIEGIGSDYAFDERETKHYWSNGFFNGTYLPTFTINNQSITAVATNTCVQYIGLKENKSSYSFRIYPNPSTDFITVQCNDLNIQNFKFIVLDILGNALFTSTDKTFKIDHLKSGIYFIKCFNADTRQTITQKFIRG